MPGSVFCVLWSSRLVVLLFALLIYSFGFATLMPLLPTLLTNYFASRHAGCELDCQQFNVGQQPAACQDAHADVVQWTSWTSLVANTFLSFIFSPMVGDLSDSYGRKPFIIGGLALSTLPIVVVYMYLTRGLSLLWYYPCNALTSIISVIVVFLSYAADVLQPQHRTTGFGLIIAAFSTGFMLGPLLGSLLQPTAAALVAGGGCLASIAVVALTVPESRPPATAAATQETTTALLAGDDCVPRPNRPNPLDACLSLRKSWALINSSTLFRRLALCMAIVGIVAEGIQDMLVQYLQLVVGFNTSDQSLLIVVLGGANLLVQAALLPWLVSLLGERRLLLVGLVFMAAEQALLAVTAAKWQAFAAVALGSLSGVAYPAISSIKSTHSRADQQGLVQGALAGIRALATGLGPLAFAQLFAMCTRTSAALGYQPGIVFWTTGALTVTAIAVAAAIPAHMVQHPGAHSNQVINSIGASRHAAAAAAPSGQCPAIVDDNDADISDAIPHAVQDKLGKKAAAKHLRTRQGAEVPAAQYLPTEGCSIGSDGSPLLCAGAVAAWQADMQSGLESTSSFVAQHVVDM
jgi:MFS family permease